MGKTVGNYSFMVGALKTQVLSSMNFRMQHLTSLTTEILHKAA